MTFEDYKTVLYRQPDAAWVAEIPAIPGCYALMPTREEALQELADVFAMIADEYRDSPSRRHYRNYSCLAERHATSRTSRANWVFSRHYKPVAMNAGTIQTDAR
jgi:predicted RNase H-like HicB family nuclease